MKTAIVVSTPEVKIQPLGLGRDFENNVKKAAELGYDGIELFVGNPNQLDIQKIKNLAADYNLKIPAVGTGLAYVHHGLSFTSTDKEIREKAVEFVKKCVEVCKELESGVIIGSIKGKYQISYEDRWYYLKGCLAECVKEAANCGVYILLEPLNRYESNIINTLDEGIRLIKELSSDQIKLMGDTFHMNIEEQSIYDAIKNAKRYLAHFHLADNNRLAPGQGHLDFKKIIKALKEIGYKGFVSAEILPKPDQYTAAKLAIEHIKSLI